MIDRIPSMFAFALLMPLGCAVPDRGDPIATPPDAGRDATPEVRNDTTTLSEIASEVAVEVEIAEPDPLSFADDGVHAVLIAACSTAGCHGSGAGGYSLIDDVDADYVATLDRVVPGDALASKLVKKGANISSHTGGPSLQEGTPEYDLVIDWIDQGANP